MPLLHEQFAERLGETRIQIFATDVSDASIEFAVALMSPGSVRQEHVRKARAGRWALSVLRDLWHGGHFLTVFGRTLEFLGKHVG